MFGSVGIVPMYLGTWDITGLKANLLLGSSLNINDTNTTDNYDNTLLAWSKQEALPARQVQLGTSKYSQLGKIGKDILISKGWTFIDGGYEFKFIPTPIEDYVLATDDDFSGTTDGSFKYIGTDEYIIIPKIIKGVTITKTNYMFGGGAPDTVKGVALEVGNSVTNMTSMFNGSQATTLDLSRFNTSNVTSMSSMFSSSRATSLDLTGFNTSNVDSMNGMFYASKATSLDLSSFDTSKVASMNQMFETCKATTGYAKTQADADKFNSTRGKPSGLNFIVKP